MTKDSQFTFKDFTKLPRKQLLAILDWRNHPSVSQGMLNEHVTKEEHFAFTEKLRNIEEKKYWLVLMNEEQIGVFYLTDITNRSAEIGLYLNPNKIGQGLGTSFLQAALDFVKHSHTLKLLKLEVFATNASALHLYTKLGFVRKGTREHSKGTLVLMELSLNDI